MRPPDCLPVLTMALSIAGCDPMGGSETYAISPAEMQEKLAASELPVENIGSGGYGLRARTTKLGDGSLSWIIVSENGRDLVRIHVTFSEVSGGSKFAVDVTGATPTAEQGLVENPSFRSHFKEFALEHCDAVLDGRLFNSQSVHARTVAPNATEMSRTARSMDAAGSAHQQREAANMEKAYREEPKGGPWD